MTHALVLDAVDPGNEFQANIDFLDSRREMLSQKLVCAAIRQRMDQAQDGEMSASDRESLCQGLAHAEALRDQASAQRDFSQETPAFIPFLHLVQQCHLNAFEAEAILVLFFMAISPNFRRLYNRGGFPAYGGRCEDEIHVGDLIQILAPDSLGDHLAARKYFSVSAPMIKHHLIELIDRVEFRASILDVEIRLAPRLVNWISGDANIYHMDSPYRVEYPTTPLSQVVLPAAQLRQVLDLVEGHAACVQKRAALGVDELVSYGRSLAILEYGPPGTGKTMLARALAHHTGRPLVSLPASDTARNRHHSDDPEEVLSKFFREAQLQNGIAFIDECERFCRLDSDWLPALLVELERTDALVLMATNRPEVLAPALDRRFALKLPFRLPDIAARTRIWQGHIPSHIRLGGEVDFEYLARTFPLSGGYIKNAALTAIHRALAHHPSGDVCLTQADLESAAGLQEVHLGAGCRNTMQTRIELDDLFISEGEKAQVQRVIRTAQHYRKALAPYIRLEHAPGIAAGYKVLFHGLYPSALQAAEAVAGALGMSVDRIDLSCVVQAERATSISLPEIFASAVSTGHLLVFEDRQQVLGRLNAGEMPDDVRDFFDAFAAYRGTAILVSDVPCHSRRVLSSRCHAQVCFQTPPRDVQHRCWQHFLGDADFNFLADRYDLSPDQIAQAAHRAVLYQAGEGMAEGLNERLLEAAIADVLKAQTGVSRLFG